MKSLKMVDLKSQYLKIKPEIDNAVLKILDNTNFILGEEVNNFANDLQRYLNVKYVIPCANGTDALQIALMALKLPKGSEVILADFCYIAAAEAVSLLGYKPVFVDVEPGTFNINPKEIEAKITDRTKVIIPVHLFGQSCNMEPIIRIAQKYNLYIVEDNAQSIGAHYTFSNGETKRTGTIGHVGTTSFFPSKNLGAMGDGGAIFTNDEELANTLKTIANHGQKERYYHDMIGVNSRLDTIQAAILGIKLKHLDTYIAARRKAADYYDQFFRNKNYAVIPERSTFADHVFHQYTLKIKDGKRDGLKAYLDKEGVPAMIYYPVALQDQKAFANHSKDEDLHPNTQSLCKEVISLAMHSELEDEQLQFITSKVEAYFHSH
ncbi:MAG: DegT/DnrJ/EryC1/StrS family aminotransferase [Bacteroidota bacterium]|nr:DegT/DnrJ/EryC1/StrS family aminotransferase [Bacteroidota bacterium]